MCFLRQDVLTNIVMKCAERSAYFTVRLYSDVQRMFETSQKNEELAKMYSCFFLSHLLPKDHWL